MQMRKPPGIFLVQSFRVLPFALAQPARERASQGTKPPRSQTIRHKNISVHWLPPHNNLIITAVSHQHKPVTSMGTTDKGFSPSNALAAWNNTRHGSFGTRAASLQGRRRCPVPPLRGTGGVTWRDSLWLCHTMGLAQCGAVQPLQFLT